VKLHVAVVDAVKIVDCLLVFALETRVGAYGDEVLATGFHLFGSDRDHEREFQAHFLSS